MSSLYVEFKRFYKKMTEKKPSTFDRECLCLSFTIALYVPFYTDPEYPISTALDCFLSTMLFLGWLRLATVCRPMVCEADNPLLALELNRSAYRMLLCLEWACCFGSRKSRSLFLRVRFWDSQAYGFATASSVSLYFSTKHFSLGVLSSRGFRFRYNV